MGRNQNDFVLDSKGRCFLCLDKTSTVKYEQGSEPPQFPKYSLHYLSRYLKMDLRKVFKDTEQIPPQLLSKVEHSRLKVELCDGCVQLTEHFYENYRQLEKAEMKLGSCLRLIHAKFLNASEAGKTKEFKKLTNLEPQLQISSNGELEILEVLREEAFQKSHHKLRAGVPRVKCRNLTNKEIRWEKLKFKPNIDIANKQQSYVLASHVVGSTKSKSGLQGSDSEIKMETQDFLSDDDNGPSNDFNSQSDNEAMCEGFEDTEVTIEENNDMNNTGPGPSGVVSLATKTYRKLKTNTNTERPGWIINPETGKYKCGICLLEFAKKHVVQTHYESVHQKIRFKCVTCGKQFSQRGPCDRHQKTVHGGVRYACQVCNKAFTQSGTVRLHLRTTDCGKKLGLKPN